MSMTPWIRRIAASGPVPTLVAVLVVTLALPAGRGVLYAQGRGAASAPATRAQGAPGGEMGFYSARILKQGDEALRWSVALPGSCPACALVSNEFTEGENYREVFFHLQAPRSLRVLAGVKVRVEPGRVKGVIVGRTRVPFTRVKDGIVFDAPLPDAAAWYSPWGDSETTLTYTFIDTRGVLLRVEHADERLRRGPYATGPFPWVERRAALNLEFAAREAIYALGLDRVVENALRPGFGAIELMGFDTNYPTYGPNRAHPDSPPHWHMFMSPGERPWDQDQPHIYIGPDGLLERDVVNAHLELGRGETDHTLLPDGTPLFSLTIAPDGSFLIGTATATCHLAPAGHGFDSGVEVSCDRYRSRRRIRAEDDVRQGRLRVFVDDRLRETYTYDVDTYLLTHSDIDVPRPWE